MGQAQSGESHNPFGMSAIAQKTNFPKEELEVMVTAVQLEEAALAQLMEQLAAEVLEEEIARRAREDEARKAAEQAANLGAQGQIAKDRQKRRDAKEQDAAELEVVGDTGTEIVVAAEFLIGKLGFELDGNCVTKVTEAGKKIEDGGQGIKVGWVVGEVGAGGGTDTHATGAKPMVVIGSPGPAGADGDEDETQDARNAPVKKKIVMEVTRVFKKLQKPALFKFRAPIEETGYSHCIACDKFQVTSECFDEAQVANGPGRSICSVCEEFAGGF